MPWGGLLFESSCTCCEDSCFLGRGGSSLWQSCRMHGALAPTCSAVKAGLRIWEVFPHTQEGCLYTNTRICILCGCVPLNWSSSPLKWTGGRWSLQAHSREYQFAWARPCFWSRLLFSADCSLFPHLLSCFSVQKHCLCFASLKSCLAMQETPLCPCAIQPQHLRKQTASSGDWWCSALRWEVFWISPICRGLFSCSPLHPQCVLHLPQLCRDNLHSPSSLAATPSRPWAKKSPYCSKEHMQQSLMLTLIVPIQTTQ